MAGKVTSFEDLIIWQKAQQLAVKIYRSADANMYIKNDYSLKDQLKRAAISVSDNIAEGFDYNNNPDFHRYLRIAKGSCGELRNKILFLINMNYLDGKSGNALNEEIKVLGKQIGLLIKKVKQNIIDNKPTGSRKS
jgi:four helix bundle protein